MKYWAFLSYSHTDRKWGDWLHKALETYRVPRHLIGKESRDGKVPPRLFPIFRDREELPVSADLGSNINEALRESRYLIVVCSPRAAQSRWVGEEIKTFKRLGREDRILALIIDGEPNASDGKPGFVSADECFPEPLRYRFGADGQLCSERTEPIAADAREGKDGRNNAKLKLLAGLLGINYDELKQRDQDCRLRRARGILATAAILLAIFAALSIALFLKQREATRAREQATRSRDEARARLSDNYLDRGLALLKSGDRTQGAANLVAALRADPTNNFAADRLLFELNYGDWLLAKTVVAIPEDLQRFSRSHEETSLLKARFSSDGKDLEAITLDFDGRPARVFHVNLTQHDWKLVADQRKPLSASPDRFLNASHCEDYEVRLTETNPELKRLKQILNRDFNEWPPSLCFSDDRRWAAFVDYNSDIYPSGASPIHLIDWSQGKEITPKNAGVEVTVGSQATGEEVTKRELLGLPAFDSKHSFVWVFREGRRDYSTLEGIDLVTGDKILERYLYPQTEGLRGS